MRILKSVGKNEYGFYEVAVKLTPAELGAYYAAQFYRDCVTVSYAKEYTDDELTHINNKNCESSAVIKRYFNSDLAGKKFLDIGCGEGFTLKNFKLQAMQLYKSEVQAFPHPPQPKPLLPMPATGGAWRTGSGWSRRYDR